MQPSSRALKSTRSKNPSEVWKVLSFRGVMFLPSSQVLWEPRRLSRPTRLRELHWSALDKANKPLFVIDGDLRIAAAEF